MEKLSAVILTYNEERNIERCLESVLPLADEVLVVDSFSTDSTEAICKSYNVRFVQHAFEGYIEQKNYAMKLATYPLILSLDADEALSPKLAASVAQIKSDRKFDGYTMNRLSNYCGKWIRHSGWYPDRKLRLVDRNSGFWGGINPHDQFIMKNGGAILHIEGDIFHYSYYTLEEHRNQVMRFAEISANALYQEGVRSGVGKILYKPVARFLRAFILKAGFLDGREGWVIARMTAWASYLRYSKLYKLQRQA